MIYKLTLGGGISDAIGKLKDLFGKVADKILEGAGSMITFFKEGMTRLIDDFPTIPIPDFKPASIFAGIIEKVPGGEKLLNFTIPKWVPLIGGMGIGGILEGLPGLQEVLGFFAKFIPGLGNYVEGGKLTKIPNLFLLTPPGVPFLVPHVANSFLPGTFPASGDSPQPASESEPPMKSAKEAKEEEKEKKKVEAEQKREEIKAKIGDVAGKVGGFFKNVGKGIKDIGGKLIEKHPAVMAAKSVKGVIEDKGGLKTIGKGIGEGLKDIGGKVISKHPAVMASKAIKGAIQKRGQEGGSSLSPGGATFSPVNEALNSKGLEQFAPYENTDSEVTTVIKEVPILVGGGGASPAENNEPVIAGGSSGEGSNPFASLYRGDG
jgi:hypothetical protein